MPTKIDIINKALQDLSANYVTSDILDADSTREAIIASVAWPFCLDEVVSAGNNELYFPDGCFLSSLARDTNVPAFDYNYQYILPADPFFLRLISIAELDEDLTTTYRIQGRRLLTDLATVSLRYIGRVTEPEYFSPYLTRALILKLKIAMCLPLTQSRSLYTDLMQLYEITVLPDCLIAASNQSFAVVPLESSGTFEAGFDG